MSEPTIVYHWAPGTVARCGRKRLPRFGAELERHIPPSSDGSVHLRARDAARTTCEECRVHVEAEYHRELYVPSGTLVLAPGAEGLLTFGPMQRPLRAIRRVYVELVKSPSGEWLAGADVIPETIGMGLGETTSVRVRNPSDFEVHAAGYITGVAERFFL
jgi:hypothetical protein